MKLITSKCKYPYAVKIQSYFKGYKTRKYLNDIFNRLPQDLQNHIVYFMRKDFYIEKLNKKLESIVRRKISKYFMKINDAIYYDQFLPFYLINYLNKNENYINILYIHKLFIKYNSILTKKKFVLEKLYKVLDKLYKNAIYDYRKFEGEYYYNRSNNLLDYVKDLLITYNCIRS